jgi:hypothetical protein
VVTLFLTLVLFIQHYFLFLLTLEFYSVLPSTTPMVPRYSR